MKILLGSVSHRKVHPHTVQCPRVASSIVSSALQRFCHVVSWSLESIPAIISVGNTSTHLIFWWQKHQTTAFVQGSGTATLSLTSSLKSPQGHLIKADDRDSKKIKRYKINTMIQKVLIEVSWNVMFHPWNTYFWFKSKFWKKKKIDHSELCYSVCSHLINSMRFINHGRLTFIEEPMVWSCGLGDSFRGDKCCYLFGARINAMRSDWQGKAWKEMEKNWTVSLRAPVRLQVGSKY